MRRNIFTKYIIFLLFVLCFYNLKAQNTDSLDIKLGELSIEKPGSKELADFMIYVYKQKYVKQPFSAIQQVMGALQIYQQIKDSIGIASSSSYLGDHHFNRQFYGMAMKYYLSAQQIYENKEDKLNTGYLALKIGETYFKQRIDKKAEKLYERALKIFKEADSKKGISLYYNKKAEFQFRNYKGKEAFELLNKSLEITKRLNDDTLIATTYSIFANLYFQAEEYADADKYCRKAYTYFKRVGSDIKAAEIKVLQGDISMIEEKPQKAHDYYIEAWQVYIKTEVQEKIAETQLKISETYLLLKKYLNAIKLTKTSLEISFSNELPEIRKEAYRILSEIYSKQKKYENAYKYMNLYSKLSDTILNTEQEKHTFEQQVNLATEEDERRIERLERQTKLQDAENKTIIAEKNLLYTSLAGVVIILILAGFFGFKIYKANNETKKTNAMLMEKNEEINQQKEEISAQNDKLETANVAITKQRDQIKNTNEKIQSSINYASRIQRAMLPNMKEVRQKLPDSFVVWSPRDAVSGDFFWYADIKDEKGNEKTLITAIDCTGHGIPGAFMSMIGDALLNQIVYQQKIIDPDIILTELHNGIATSLQQGKTQNTDGMDVAICVIDRKNKFIEYAGAKNPFVYIQNNELKIIKANPFSVGGLCKTNERNFTKHKIDISVPTTFYIYSDGFQDQFGGNDNKKYMAINFRNFLYNIHKLPMNEQAVTIAVELDEWKGIRLQMDDVLIIGVKL